MFVCNVVKGQRKQVLKFYKYLSPTLHLRLNFSPNVITTFPPTLTYTLKALHSLVFPHKSLSCTTDLVLFQS
jgi:hypothetical protein